MSILITSGHDEKIYNLGNDIYCRLVDWTFRHWLLIFVSGPRRNSSGFSSPILLYGVVSKQELNMIDPSKMNKEKLESEIQTDICKYLQEQGHFFWRQNNMPVFAKNNAGKMTYRALPKYAKKGIPDIILIDTHGVFWGLEVKRPGHTTLRPDQATFCDSIRRNMGNYFVVTCINDVIAVGL